MDGWRGGRAGIRIAYSNQKPQKLITSSTLSKKFRWIFSEGLWVPELLVEAHCVTSIIDFYMVGKRCLISA